MGVRKYLHEFHAYTNVPLNDANYDYRVNVLEYWETKKDGRKQHFSWVTKLTLTEDNVYQVMRAGRSRWKIENETFNTTPVRRFFIAYESILLVLPQAA